MPIFINWFEVDISAPVQKFFIRDFDSWDASHAFHERVEISREKFCRFEVRKAAKTIARTVLFGQVDTIPEHFELCDVDLSRERKVAEHVIELNLGSHLESRGLNVEYNKFGVRATRPDFRADDIGFCAEVGIEFKSYYLHYQRQHGITLDWKIRQYFDRSLDHFPDIRSFLGLPVILKKEGDTAASPSIPSEYNGRYLGVVTDFEKDQVVVLCRDGLRRAIRKGCLLPEAKAEVVATLGALSKEQRGPDSIQRRVLTLSYSLTTTGRRNVKVLQDKLRAAVDFLSPNNRPAITVDFMPYSVGKMKISTTPATARTERG